MSITGVMLDDINGGSLGLLASGTTQTLPDALAQELINRGAFRRTSLLLPNSAPLQALLDPDTGVPSGVGLNGDKNAGMTAVAAAVSVLTRIKSAMAAALFNNPADLAPWGQPTQWVTGETYYGGQMLQNGGNLYLVQPNQGSAVAGGIAPVHTGTTPVFDGAGSTGNCLIYMGRVASALAVPEIGAPPGSSSQDMQGMMSVLQGGTINWSATSAAISASTAMVVTSVTGTIRPGDPVPQLGSNIYIKAQASGTAGGAGTYTLNTAVTFAGGTVSWTGLAALGLTVVTQPTYAYSPVRRTNVPSQAASCFQFTGCTIKNGILTVGGVTSGAWVNPCGIWTGSELVQVYSQLTGTPGGAGTYQVNSNATNVSTPQSYTNVSYPAADYWITNVSLPATPSTNQDGPQIRNSWLTNARWLAVEHQYGNNNAYNYTPTFVINGRRVGYTRPVWSATGNNGNLYLLDLSKVQSVDGQYRVQAYTAGASQLHGLWKIYTAPGDYLIPDSSNGLRCSMDGDSLVSFNNNANLSAIEDAAQLADMLGFDEYLQNSVGGTSMSTNGGTSTKFSERFDRIAAFQPHVHVTCGDHNNGATASATRILDWATYIRNFRTKVPAGWHVITGSKALRGDTAATLAAIDADIKAAIAQVGDPMTVFVPVTTDPTGDAANGTGWYWNGFVAGRNFTNIGSFTDPHSLPAERYGFLARVAKSVRGWLGAM